MQERGPVFIARDFVVRFLRDETPLDFTRAKTPSLNSEEENSKVTQVKFTVGCGNITQRINLPFVRLTLQLFDMLELLSQLIENGNDREMPSPQFSGLVPPRDRTDGVQSLRTKPPPHGHVKCWRIMYQIVDLYSSLPREAKNKGFMRRTTIGRGLAGEFKNEILPTCFVVFVFDFLS